MKPFDEAWDRVKVDQKDLDEHRNSWPSWRQSRTGEEPQDRRRNEIGVQTLETSEEAKRWNGGVDHPKRNDNAWRVSIGNAS